MTKTRLTSKWALLAMVATIAVAFGAIMMATQIGAHNGIGPSNGIGIHICIGISESNDTEGPDGCPNEVENIGTVDEPVLVPIWAKQHWANYEADFAYWSGFADIDGVVGVGIGAQFPGGDEMDAGQLPMTDAEAEALLAAFLLHNGYEALTSDQQDLLDGLLTDAQLEFPR